MITTGKATLHQVAAVLAQDSVDRSLPAEIVADQRPYRFSSEQRVRRKPVHISRPTDWSGRGLARSGCSTANLRYSWSVFRDDAWRFSAALR